MVLGSNSFSTSEVHVAAKLLFVCTFNLVSILMAVCCRPNAARIQPFLLSLSHDGLDRSWAEMLEVIKTFLIFSTSVMLAPSRATSMSPIEIPNATLRKCFAFTRFDRNCRCCHLTHQTRGYERLPRAELKVDFYRLLSTFMYDEPIDRHKRLFNPC